MIIKLKLKTNILKKWFLIIVIFNLGLFISFINQYCLFNLYNKGNDEFYDFTIEKNLKSSSDLIYNENFQSIEFNNYSITNTSGWGRGFLQLPYQNLDSNTSFTKNINYIKAIDFFENLAFLADNSSGLKIINNSNPLNPYLIKSVGDSYNETLDISIEGKFAYIADGVDGLEILDLTNPVNPQKISSWSNSYNVTNVFIKDNFAFLSVKDLGVEILNISNPHSISKVGNWTNFESPCRVEVIGNYLFIANKNNNLEIIDISNLKDIFRISQLSITGNYCNFQIKRDYLFLANGLDGLKVIDIQDISNPTVISTFYEDGIVMDVLIDENYAFLACDYYGVIIIDILNPLEPTLVDYWNSETEVCLIEKHGNFLFLGEKSYGLEIIRLSKITETRKIAEFSQNINAKDVILNGDLAYICAVEEDTYKGGLFIINVSNPYNPQKLGNFSDGKYDFYDIELKNDICYAVTTENGLISLDISDPSNIEILDSIGGYLMNFSNRIEIYDNIAYVANGLVGLDVYNITEPLNLKFITNYPSDGVCYDVKIRNNYAFIAKGYEGIEILNISDLNNIKSVSRYGGNYNNSQSIAFYGNYLLIADRFDGVEILDISDLLNPQKIGYYNDTYNRAMDVEVVDNLAIVSDVNDGIEIINITNPYTPFEIGNYIDNYNQTIGCAASSRFIYVADSHDGLQVVQYKDHLFNLYKNNAIAQSKIVDYTYATITNATMVISAEIPNGTSLEYYISNDNGKNWDSVMNNSFHQFSVNGSDLLWKIVLSTTNDVFTPEIFNIYISYSAINTPPSILNISELQNLEIWNQLEDFGNFSLNLSSYKTDVEFESEYLNWTFQDVNNSLFSVILDENDKDVLIFHSIDNIYGSDEFDLYLYDPAGANTSIKVTLNVESVNDAPFFIEINIFIDHDQANNKMSISFEANDIDNDTSELRYSIFYGDGSVWVPIVTDYDDETYLWNTQTIPEGNYRIKLSVSDGMNETIWISSTRYHIINPFNTILSITLVATVTGAGVALFVFFLIKFRILKKDRREEPVI